MRTEIAIAVLSYFMGSIPFGYLLIHVFRGEDIRKTGSGNIGATNVSRKSPALGVMTLLLDAGKGAAAVVVSYLIAGRVATGPPTYDQMALSALFAVIGHVFPVWLRFRGGKGVATGLGSFVMIAPEAVLVCAGVFVITVLLFRYVSLGSIVAVGTFPVLAWFLHQFGISRAGLALISSASLLIIAKHRANIRRLLAGNENKLGARTTA